MGYSTSFIFGQRRTDPQFLPHLQPVDDAATSRDQLYGGFTAQTGYTLPLRAGVLTRSMRTQPHYSTLLCLRAHSPGLTESSQLSFSRANRRVQALGSLSFWPSASPACRDKTHRTAVEYFFHLPSHFPIYPTHRAFSPGRPFRCKGPVQV